MLFVRKMTSSLENQQQKLRDKKIQLRLGIKTPIKLYNSKSELEADGYACDEMGHYGSVWDLAPITTVEDFCKINGFHKIVLTMKSKLKGRIFPKEDVSYRLYSEVENKKSAVEMETLEGWLRHKAIRHHRSFYVPPRDISQFRDDIDYRYYLDEVEVEINRILKADTTDDEIIAKLLKDIRKKCFLGRGYAWDEELKTFHKKRANII